MGNASICINTRDYVNERKNTLQYPSHSKDQENLFSKPSDYYNNTNPTYIIFPPFHNNSNFVTINSRKWYKAAPKKSKILSIHVKILI